MYIYIYIYIYICSSRRGAQWPRRCVARTPRLPPRPTAFVPAPAISRANLYGTYDVRSSTSGVQRGLVMEDLRDLKDFDDTRCSTHTRQINYSKVEMRDSGLVGSTVSEGGERRGAARAEDAQGTPTQSHTSPSIATYEDCKEGNTMGFLFSSSTGPAPGCASGGECGDRVLDGPASGGKGSMGRNWRSAGDSQDVAGDGASLAHHVASSTLRLYIVHRPGFYQVQ